jgi:hypothetical protein
MLNTKPAPEQGGSMACRRCESESGSLLFASQVALKNISYIRVAPCLAGACPFAFLLSLEKGNHHA